MVYAIYVDEYKQYVAVTGSEMFASKRLNWKEQEWKQRAKGIMIELEES